MSAYAVREVAAVLGMSPRAIYALVKHGFITPARGTRRQLQFSFQDILLLKTANGLAAARIPRRRIRTALAALRRQIPPQLPLAGLRIKALGDRVVAQSTDQSWDAESGQGLFEFDVTQSAGRIQLIDAAAPSGGCLEGEIQGWFDTALALEESDSGAARACYERVIAADDAHVAAYVNCGRLLHEAHEWAAAERLYRRAIAACTACATLFFNLAVLLEDQARHAEAIGMYQQALQCDPDHSDSHHNLARLFHAAGRSQHAIRHFNHYRRLTR